MTRGMAPRLVAWKELPFEAERLEGLRLKEQSRLDGKVAERQHERLRADRESERIVVQLLTPAGRKARGFVAWRPIAGRGRRIEFLYLEPRYRSATRLQALFTLIREQDPASGPVLASTDLCLGIAVGKQAGVLVSQGYVHVDHAWMVLAPNRSVAVPGKLALGTIRHAKPQDASALIRLYVRAYARSEDQLLWPTMDLERDASTFIRGVFSGKIYSLDNESSFVLEWGGKLIGAILTTVDPGTGPFIGDLMIDPAFQGRGLGRHLLARSVAAFRVRAPSAPVGLQVEVQNRSAFALYRSFGFRSRPHPPGMRHGAWLRKLDVERIKAQPVA